MRFRESFNKKDITSRQAFVKEIADAAQYTIPEEKGFKVIKDHQYPEVPELIKDATKIVTENDVEALRINKKTQLLTGLLKKNTLTPDSPYVQFALRKDILATVANYLGVMPVVNRIDVWYSQASPEVADTQMHHLDWEAKRQVKLFLYVTDVVEETGPFVAMAAKDSETIQKKINYKFGQNIPDEVIDNALADREEMVGIADKGTMIFVDTSRCFHYGSRVQNKATYRTVILLQYLRPQSYAFSLDYKKNSPYRFLATNDMPEYQRLALGAQ